MRDYLFLLLLPFMLYFMAQRPFIALGMWVWTSMFFPNAWMYGIAAELRYNLIFAGVCMLGYLAMKDKPRVRFGSVGIMIVAFFLWTTLTTTFTQGVPEISWEIWNRFLKITLLFVFVLLVVRKRLHLDFILWCVVFSIGFFASLEAVKFLATGGGHKIEGFAGHVLGDRNELAIAFVMSLPLFYYLLREYGERSKLIKTGMLGLMALTIVAVVGTESRGGLVALLGLAAYMFMKSDNKILMGTLSLVLVAILSGFVSEEWQSRMDTIGAADQDESFMGRVVAWKLSFILALENPLLGGGFKTLEFFPMWQHLSEQFNSYPFFYTGVAMPDTTRSHAAHSIYFQVLGDHGFVGLALYLGILWLSFRNAGRVARDAVATGAPLWISRMATMLQLSIFAFALGGAALSFAYFDLIFTVHGLVLVLKHRILPKPVTRSSLR